MAPLPCDRHRTSQPGRLCGLYPVLVVDGVRKAKYLRYCVPCTQDVLALHRSDWADYALKVELDGTTTCSGCLQVLQANAQLSRFFCTAYVNGKDRRDYAALYCPDCALKTAQEFDLEL